MPKNTFFPRAFIAALSLAPAAFADTVTTFQTGAVNNATCGIACPVNSSVVFTAKANGMLLVTLTNVSVLGLDQQVLTAVAFNFAGMVNAGSIATQATQPLVQFTGSNGSSSDLTTVGVTATSNWGTLAGTGGFAGYDVLTNLGFNAKGSEGILGNGGGNASSNVQNNHGPYFYGTATFTLNVAGVNANTVITGAQFNYGTALNDAVNANVVTSATPEPGTISMALGGAALLLLARRRKSA